MLQGLNPPPAPVNDPRKKENTFVRYMDVKSESDWCWKKMQRRKETSRTPLFLPAGADIRRDVSEYALSSFSHPNQQYIACDSAILPRRNIEIDECAPIGAELRTCRARECVKSPYHTHSSYCSFNPEKEIETMPTHVLQPSPNANFFNLSVDLRKSAVHVPVPVYKRSNGFKSNAAKRPPQQVRKSCARSPGRTSTSTTWT